MPENAKDKIQCQICKGYLFDDDDIVVCPECGAKHHRDCWMTIGHCGVAGDHGTENQYDKLQKVAEEPSSDKAKEAEHICHFCGRSSKAADNGFCPYCGQAFNQKENISGKFILHSRFPFDAFGGINKDSRIEDVPVTDIATFLGGNSPKYIPLFATLNRKNKKSWNWMAFLFPSAWNFCHKMYSNGILYLILAVASKLCFVPFNQIFNSLVEGESRLTYPQIYQLVEENITSFSLSSLIMLFVGIVLMFVPRIISGLRADWSYREHTLKTIKEINSDQEVEDREYELARAGSVNLFLMIVSLVAETYLPIIITMFL